jgi:hypothetical protein
LNVEFFFTKTLFNSKLKIMGEFGCTLAIGGRPLWIGFFLIDLKKIRCKLWDILNFE